jgi:PAS domain S-box-containing protein
MLHDDIKNVLGDQQFSTVSLIAAQVEQEIDSRIKGLESVALGITPAHIAQPAALQELLENRPVLLSLFNDGVAFGDLDGTVRADFPRVPGRVGANFMERDYIVGPLKEGKVTIGKPVRSKLTQNPSFVVAIPVKDREGKIIGVLAGVINLGKPNFLDRITDGRYGKTGGYLILAPQHRLVVTATDKRRIMEELPAAGTSSWIDRVNHGYEGSSIFINPVGIKVLTSAKSISIAGWIMVAALPTAEAFMPIQAMQKHMFVGALLLTLISGILTWWTLTRQLSPMLAAATTIATLANVNAAPQPLPITSRDEIGALIGGFNRLLETLSQREKALNESEQNLAITLHSIGDAVIATDAEGRVTRMNPTAERLTGWTLADAYGHPLAEILRIVNATSRETVPDPVQLVMARGEVVGLANHTVLLARDGREYHIADSAAPIRNATGKIVGAVLVFSDVTERKQIEEQLANFSQRLLLATSAARLAVWDWNVRENTMVWDDRMFELYGVSLDTSSNNIDAWMNGLHPEDKEAAIAECQAALAGEREFDTVFRVLRPDGTVKHLKANALVIRGEDGKPARMLGTNADVTDQVQAETALREISDELLRLNQTLDTRVRERTVELARANFMLEASTQYNRSLLEATRDPLVTISAKGKITDVNEATVQVTGVGRKELIGTDFADYFTDPAKAREGYERAFAEGFVTDYALAISHVSGKTTEVLYNASVYRDEAGAVVGVFAAARDVTNRNLAEEAARLASLELERSNKELEQFAYVASHDLQEPVRTVVGFIQLLEKRIADKLDAKSTEYMRFAVDGALHMRRMIQDILTYSRLDSQGTPLEHVESAEAVQAALALLDNQISATGAEVEMLPLPTVIADRIQLVQLFQNLIGNAIKYCKKDVPQVHIEAHREGGQWRFTVTDNGIGIEADFREWIFVIFQRLHTREEYDGTGLGLAICRRIIQRHHGEIGVDAAPGCGSTFWFTLPAVEGT